MHHGSCLCGSVTFQVRGPLRGVVACHCSQCRKTSGHYWAASSALLQDFELLEQEGLSWFQSSGDATRGFCKYCGASLFWQQLGEGRISIAAGALEAPTGLTMATHIHTEVAGDYYAPDKPMTGAPGAPKTLKCSCLCGETAFTLPGPAGPVTACHCPQCRKLSGHYAASFDAVEAQMAWTKRDKVAEYETPGGGQRGFCTGCGTSLYFRSRVGEFSVEMGVIDGPSGGTLVEHIFMADKGDYYEIAPLQNHEV